MTKKPTQEVIFSSKMKKDNAPSTEFIFKINIPISN